MCVSNNAIEQQAYSFATKICKQSLYKPLRFDTIGNTSILIETESSHQNSFDSLKEEALPLITKVILEDKYGRLFSIEPNDIGLRFAKGDITYNDYLRLQKKGNRQLILIFLGVTGLFSGMSWVFINLLI